MTLNKNRYACALYLKFNLNSRVVYSFMFLNSSFYINITPKTNIFMIINKFMKEKKERKKKKSLYIIYIEHSHTSYALALKPLLSLLYVCGEWQQVQQKFLVHFVVSDAKYPASLLHRHTANFLYSTDFFVQDSLI